MTIASELTTLNTTKTNIKAAIEAKGVTVGTVPFADYPSKIALISGGGATPPTPEAWVRNPSWPQLSCVSGDNKATGLYAVWPNGSNFAAITAGTVSVGYTVNWGDGTTTNYANGNAAQYIFDYSNANLSGTDAPVTFTASTSTVNRTAHGYTNGMTVQFYNIVTTTGISEAQVYYVINATTDTFQISATSGGTAITLTGDGSATLLPYKIATVTITPQSGVNITSLDLSIKHTQTNVQNAVSSGWLEFKVALANLTSLTIGSTTTTGKFYHRYLQNVELIQIGTITSFANLFGNCVALESCSFPTNTTSVTNTSNMFANCYNIQSIPLFNTSGVTSMSSMFSGCYSLISIPLFNTSAVTNMSNMFLGCYSLFEIPELNTSNVTIMNSMFNNCTTLLEIPLLDTSKVTNMSQMFSSCRSLKTIPLLNTANVTDMGNMFTSCAALETIPLINTIKVTNMSQMFNDCFSLRNVPLLNTVAVTNMSSMFFGCYNLKSVPLFNTANVTSSTGDMFRNCFSLVSVPLFDLSKTTSISGMFRGCTSLVSIPDFNTPLVTSFISAFQDCVNLREIPDLYMNAPTISNSYSSMFNGCLSLSRIRAKQFRWTFSVANCNLGATELNEIYTNLPTITGQTITVTGNWGTATDDPTIATAKGWTVTG